MCKAIGEVSAEVLDSQGRSALDLAIIGEDESLTSYLMTKVSEQVIHKGLLFFPLLPFYIFLLYIKMKIKYYFVFVAIELYR
jgi:hypothetical protein